jgi:hypothetical protein
MSQTHVSEKKKTTPLNCMGLVWSQSKLIIHGLAQLMYGLLNYGL